ncbi:MAG: transporter substrate-binding domain-containing protein [Planktotalea sp.]|uniref:transporter substrate-binding domain-containing protein n=1 Tax=Planktotalea sp. TaxID=2029877 RepID=UPI0026251799|nr:transporter substrate-binding domain-containing protein [Planktotalea sp.]MDG1076752.1 transporter substrate-binding domain-containing protein [Planktotalea sp.]
MAYLKRIVLTFLTLLSLTVPAAAQSDDPLVFATVHRPPFADTEGDQITGFSIDLMRAIADQLGHEVVFEPNTRFGDMLSAVRSERVDGAIANISITAERERTMDFSQPIFGSGIQILLPKEAALGDQFLSFIGSDALLYVVGAIVLVVLGWFLMRGKAAISSGIVGVVAMVGGFALLLVAAGTSTAKITVTALQSDVQTISDLQSRIVGTVAGSTSDSFLNKHDIPFQGFGDPDSMLRAFERDEIDTVVFDGPILAHYLQTDGAGLARLIDKIYRPKNYGILLPSGSALKEEIDLALLQFREDGTYDMILTRWFGNSFTAE